MCCVYQVPASSPQNCSKLCMISPSLLSSWVTGYLNWVGMSFSAPAFSFDDELIVFQHIDKSTRFWGKQYCLLDLVFTMDLTDVSDISCPDSEGVSYHFVRKFSLEVTFCTKIPDRVIKQCSRVKVFNVVWPGFRNLILHKMWNRDGC